MKLCFFANSVTQSKDIQVLLPNYQFPFFHRHHAILQSQRLFQKRVVCTKLDIYVFFYHQVPITIRSLLCGSLQCTCHLLGTVSYSVSPLFYIMQKPKQYFISYHDNVDKTNSELFDLFVLDLLFQKNTGLSTCINLHYNTRVIKDKTVILTSCLPIFLNVAWLVEKCQVLFL